MFSLRQPSEQTIRKFLDKQRDQPFSYREVGFSQQGAPRWYNLDHYRVKLGAGQQCFDQATGGLRRWKMFDVGWVRLWMPNTPIQVGETVAAVVNHFRFWSINASRIVYVVNEDNSVLRKFGFAYGTLKDHGERGEERFTIEWNKDDNSVWYEIFAFSRPAPLATLGYPVTRYLQKRFARDSKIAMTKAVGERF